MLELKPFATIGQLKKALDNGGRFYNFLADADDEVVSRDELAKAAGVFTAGIKAFLFLEMTRQDLSDQDQAAILAMLEPKLRRDFAKKKPVHVPPTLVDSDHKAGEAIIVTGFAREIGQHSQFSGFIFVPIVVGKAMPPMLVPIHSLYRVIELFEEEKSTQPTAVVCIPLKQKFDLPHRVQFGGVLKHMRNNSKEPPTHPVFLDAIFWMKR